MQKLTLLVALIVLLFSVSSCSLDRSNPLDPAGDGNIRVPGKVTGLSYFKEFSPQNSILLRWNELPEADGYNIYRAYSLHTKKELIHIMEFSEVTEYRDTDLIFGGRYYYYWVSGYIDYPQGRLEGKLSDYIIVVF